MNFKLFFLGLIFISFNLTAQDKLLDACKTAIREGSIGHTRVFDYSTYESGKKSYDSLSIRYLGEIVTKSQHTYRFVSCFRIIGQSMRGNSKLLVFNTLNQYLGCYYLSMPYDLPTHIKDSALVFDASGDDCKEGVRLNLSIKKGLPKEFFLPCKDGVGDIFRFE